MDCVTATTRDLTDELFSYAKLYHLQANWYNATDLLEKNAAAVVGGVPTASIYGRLIGGEIQAQHLPQPAPKTIYQQPHQQQPQQLIPLLQGPSAVFHKQVHF